MPAPRHRWLIRAEQVAVWLENTVLVVLLIGLLGVTSSQILLRNVFSVGLAWADGLIRLAVLWLALVGAIAASRDRKHIAINLADRFLPEAWLRPAGALVNSFAAAVAGVLAWYAFRFVQDSREFGDTLLGTSPAWMFQIILPIGFALVSYRYWLRFIADIRGHSE